MLRKLNQKYDRIQNQNTRFLIFMGLFLPGIFIMAMEAVTDNPIYWLLGMSYILTLGILRIIGGGFLNKK